MIVLKKLFLVLGCVFLSQTIFSQVTRVAVDINGEFVVTVSLGEEASLMINEYGEVIHVDIEGHFEYYSDFHDYEAGKLKKVGNVSFTYYSDFHDYEAGKIKKAGNIEFVYYSDFHDYESGKIKRIGNVNFDYYSDFHDYESGKIKKIGNTGFTYYSDFHDYNKGKLKKMGNVDYTYFSDFGRNKLSGKLQSGANVYRADGITFRLRNRQAR